MADEEQVPRSREELERALTETRSNGDLTAYCEAEGELEEIVIAEGDERFARLQYEEAAASWDQVAKLNRDLIDALDEASPAADDEPGPSAEELRELSGQARRLMLIAEGDAARARGQYQVTHRNPGAAVTFFEQAERVYRVAADAGARIGAFMADYAVALKEVALGTEEFVRGDYRAAASSFMRVKMRYDLLLKDLAGADYAAALTPALHFEASTLTSQFEKASYMAHFSVGEYPAAAASATILTDQLRANIEGMPEDLPGWQEELVRAQLASAEADRQRAWAYVLREDGRWDEAQEAYATARKKLEEAAEHMLRTGMPDAVAIQESLMVQASITIAAEIRQCRAEELLKREIEQLRAERAELIGNVNAAGVTVNSIQEVSQVATQTMEVTLRIEQSVRDMLPELRAAIDAAGLGEEGERLKTEAEELEASDDHALPFIERAKTFTERVAAIVKNVGDAAAPIVPVLKVLAPLVGLVL